MPERELIISESDSTKPSQVLMAVLVTAVLAGSCFLSSAPEGKVMEGARDWQPNSWLKSIVDVLNLNAQFPTSNGAAIKTLVFGIGASLASLLVGVTLLVRERQDTEFQSSGAETVVAMAIGRRRNWLWAGVLLIFLYGVWSFASMIWSEAPRFAFGGSVLLFSGILWATLVGWMARRNTVVQISILLFVVLVLTAALAIWYHAERNPLLRAKYPIGNPIFLSACLVPALFLGPAFVLGMFKQRNRTGRKVLMGSLVLVGCCACIWAFWLARSRGPTMGVAAGAWMFVMLGLAQRFHGRWIRVLALVTIVGAVGIGALYVWTQLNVHSSTGRTSSLYERFLAWDYALQMAGDKPLIGHGQAGYVLKGDSLSVADAINDPNTLIARIAHAHNEWLEILADLGAVGFMLAVGGLGATLMASKVALSRMVDPMHRWLLIGLAATLAALIVEECSGVSLRLPGLPPVFWTVLGLVWAMSKRDDVSISADYSHGTLGRIGSAAVLIVFSAAITKLYGDDFRAALADQRIAGLVDEREWEAALGQAKFAETNRLMPQRRLRAMDRLATTYVYIGQYYQSESLRYWQMAKERQDEQWLALAEDHRRTSEGSVSAGFDVLVRWLKIAPNCWNSGWIEFRLYEIKRRFAEADDNVDALRANTMAAAAALARELERRPYDARLTLSYVYLVGGDLPLSEVINRLAIPLRASPMSSDYLTMIAAVAAGPGFDDAFRPLWEEAKSAATGKISADDANPFWPEILRIAAAVRFSRLTYKQAAADVGLAIDGFYRDAPGAALAAGSAYGERAEYVFYDNPSEPAAALDTAERGLTMLPESQDGRALRQHIVFRMAIYHLAVHREDDAREMLAKYVSPADMNRRLSDLYLDLCKHINLWPVSRFPPSYPSWVQRAVELNPENEVIWKFLADLLMQQGRAADAADSLRRALSLGSDPRTAADITQLYLQRAPESEELKQLLSELEEFLAPKPFGS